MKIQRGGRRCTEFQSSQFILPHLQTYWLDGEKREREREREKQGGLRERGKEKRGERVALFALCTEGGSKEEKERKLSAVIALVGVQIAPARKIIFKRPERGGYSAKVMGKR